MIWRKGDKMINRVEVKGFKSIRDMKLELYPLNVLIGANGAGKSNFISLFQLVNQVMESQLQLFTGKTGGSDNLLHFGLKATQELSVKLFFQPNSYQFTLVPSQSNSFVFSDEQCSFQAEGYLKPLDIRLGSGHTETKMYSDAQAFPGSISDQVIDKIKSWKIFHFHDTSETSHMKQPCNIDDNITLRPDAANIAAFLYYLKSGFPRHYKNIVDTVRLVAPFFEDFILRPLPLNDKMIQLEWKEVGTDKYFNAHSLSDGTLRFVCLVVLLSQPNLPSIILLDEPELGLHPSAVTCLAGLLQSAASRTQVIAATQSVTLVNQLEPRHIIVVDRHENQSVFKHLDKQDMSDWLEDFGLGDLWEKNIFGGRP